MNDDNIIVKNKIDLKGQIREDFKDLITATGFKGTQVEFFQHLISSYTPSNLFGVDEREKINEAARIADMTTETIIVAGALQYANKIIDSVSDGKSGNADIRINNFVNGIMSYNDSATNWFEKVEITQGLLADKDKNYGGVNGGFNRANIQRYLSANRNRIDEHHAKNKIEKDHNRTVANYLRKQTNPKNEG